ncbi:MAG: hypothetical protein AB8B73_07210 [Ekhidna sp.]
MKLKRIVSIISVLFFILLAFSISYEFDNSTLKLVSLLTGLFGTLATAGASVFNPKVWNSSHGPDGIKYEDAFKMLVAVIFSLIIISSILGIFHIIPDSFNSFKFASWIVGYAAMITPNLAYLFDKETYTKSNT